MLSYGGLLAKRDRPGACELGYRVYLGKKWAGRWNNEDWSGGRKTVRAVTVHKPGITCFFSIERWDALYHATLETNAP